MIDQLVSGQPQAPQPVKAAKNDRQQAASGDRENSPDTFGEMVSRAGQQEARDKRKDDGETVAVKDDAEVARLPDSLPKVAFELTAALRGLQSPADGRVKVANFKDALKTAEVPTETGERQDALLAKLAGKLKQAAQQAQNAQETRKLAVDDRMQADALATLTPADELSLLLGLTVADEGNVKSEKKAASAEKSDKPEAGDEDTGTDALLMLDPKAERVQADPIHVPLDNRPTGAGADDASSRADAVRLVSADGRGRPVDIALPKVAGEPQKDMDKAAATAKIDTATVLEARRYLGFSPDSNANALASAAKADPTWSAALQAARRTDLGSLGNTVTEVNTLKLQMNPENLGNMVASLKLKGEELTVELRVDSIEAYRHLSADHDDIVKALQDQGFSIDKVTVQLNATDRTDTGADRDMARQEQAQREGQARRDGQGGQPGRNDEQPDDRSLRAGLRDTGDAVADNRGADGGRTGNIYL